MQAAYSRTLTTIGVLIFLGSVFVVSWTISLLTALRAAQGYSGWKDGILLGTEGVVRQDKENNCGPAALKMILDHHGWKTSLRQLERMSKLTARGSSMLALKEAAESLGLHTEGLLLQPNDLTRVLLPAVLFVAGRHFVVLDSLDNEGSLYVRDPAMGRMKILNQGVADTWKGETLVFGDDISKRNHSDLK